MMKNALGFALLLLLVCPGFAGTHSYSSSDGLLSMTTDITVNPSAGYFPASPARGSMANLTLSLPTAYFSNTNARLHVAGYGLNPSTIGTLSAINFLFDGPTYDAFVGWYNGCGYTTTGGQAHCVSIDPNYGSCSCVIANPGLSQAMQSTYVNKDKVYQFSGPAYLVGVCKGFWYVNGTYAGPANTTSPALYQFTVPSNMQGSIYNLNVEVRFQCAFGAEEIYANAGSYNIYLYNAATSFSDFYPINVTAQCVDNASIRIDSITDPINLNSQTNGQATVTMAIRNNGTVPMAINSITPSTGTYTGLNIGLPYTLAPGASVTVTGTYAYGGTLTSPTSITWYASASGTMCGNPASFTATAITTVNPPSGPVCSYFYFSPGGPLAAPASTTLLWSALRASSATLTCTNPVPYTNLQVTVPTSSLGFNFNAAQTGAESCTLTLTNSTSGLSSTCAASVQVNAAAPTCSASWSPPGPITAPGSSTLSWSAVGTVTSLARSCTGPIPSGLTSVSFPTGSQPYNFAVGQTGTENCIFTVGGPGGSNTCSAALTINAPTNPTCSISWAPPGPLTAPASGTVSWASALASSASLSCTAPIPYSLNPAPVPNGNHGFNFNATQTGAESCTLTVTNSTSGLTGSCSATLTVSAPAAATCNARWSPPGPLTTPNASNFIWNSANAVSANRVCAGPIPSSGAVGISGTDPFNFGISQVGTETCTVTFTSPGGNAVCGASLALNSPCMDAAIMTLTATDPIYVNGSAQAHITLTLTNTGNATAAVPNAASITVAGGTFAPGASVSFPLTVAANGGSVSIPGVYTRSGLASTANFSVSGTYGACGTNIPFTARYISNVLCPQHASFSLSATNPINLNGSNQSLITLTLTNTGNVSLSVQGALNITASSGIFAPAAAFPVSLGVGGSAGINGVYTAGAQSSVLFRVNASGAECGIPVAISQATNSSIVVCPVAGIAILGVSEVPIGFVNRSADIVITVINNGTVPMNVTGFKVSPGFFISPTDTFPVVMNPGDIRNFPANIKYIIGGAASLPPSVTITLMGITNAVLSCGGSNNVTDAVNEPIMQKGDLVSIIDAPLAMNQSVSMNANVTVRNRGSGNVTLATTLNVRLYHCHSTDPDDCQIFSSRNYTTDPLPAGQEAPSVLTDDFTCAGYPYIRISSTANAGWDATAEDPIDFANNNDSKLVRCSMNRCEISGPLEMRLPGPYTFMATCFDGENHTVDCGGPDGMLDIYGFNWTYAPGPQDASSFVYYIMGGMSGSANENSTIEVQNIIANGTLSITAAAKVREFNQAINCTHAVKAYGNPCVLHI